MGLESDIRIRKATNDDVDEISRMTDGLWQEYGGDYLPEVFPRWIDSDDEETAQTVIAERAGSVVGTVRGVKLSDSEAWFQGIRVDPDHRQHGVGQRLHDHAMKWAADRGAIVGRVMTMGWNNPGIRAASSFGFRPVMSYRWALPRNGKFDPDTEISVDSVTTVNRVWEYWRASIMCRQGDSLGLSPETGWALRQLTQADFEPADLLTVDDDDGPSGFTIRTRVMSLAGSDDDTTPLVEYGAVGWDDRPAARRVFSAIVHDANDWEDADIRVLIPDTITTVTDLVSLGIGISEYRMYVYDIPISADHG